MTGISESEISFADIHQVLIKVACVNVRNLSVTFQAEENLGMVMIFTLVTAVQERLNEIVDVMKKRREEEKWRREKEAEEAEKVETRI